MSKLQRIGNVLLGLVMLLCAYVMVTQLEFGYLLVILIISISAIVIGLRYLVYYFTMARYMTGGGMMLYIAIFALDLGVFSLTLNNVPRIYVLLYLVGANLISGGIELLGALDSKRQGASWRLKFAGAAASIIAAVLSIAFFRRSDNLMVYIYSAGLVYNAVCRIINAFRRSAIVYIQ